MTWKIVRKDGE